MNKNYVYLWCSQFCSTIGSWIYYSFLFAVINQKFSATAIGWLVFSYTFPSIAVIPFIGVYIDRYDKKKILVLSYLISTIFPVILLVKFNLFTIYTCSFLSSCLFAISFIATRVIIRDMAVESKALIKLYSFLAFGFIFSTMLGGAIGGILVDWVNIKRILLLNVGLLLVSTISLLRLDVSLTCPNKNKKESVFSNFLNGSIIYVREKNIVKQVSSFCIIIFLGSIVNNFIITYVHHVFPFHKGLFGMFLFGGGFGSCIGWYLTSKFLSMRELSTLQNIFQLLVPVFALAILLLASAQNKALAIFVFLLFNMVSMVMKNITQSVVYLSTGGGYLGRIISIYNAQISLFSIFGALAGGLLIDKINVIKIYKLTGGFALVISLLLIIFNMRFFLSKAKTVFSKNMCNYLSKFKS
jgi:MFS transporter, DHA3 family, macrolide efflux protein